ncbi:hypothetical protein UFOVP55_49 [uncultured Caudovirales phage]|uniref:Uncharacterized protein n=1 Tax=uncultured Caudovirales phage TaxID=2100421 RepID=A0A6J5KRB4_9CAUD|nr:hypothetical protein UFOVP55_49 [uncultured Caudovirales phage]
MMKGSPRYPYTPRWTITKQAALAEALQRLYEEFPLRPGWNQTSQAKCRIEALRFIKIGIIEEVPRKAREGGVPEDRVKVIIALLE